MEDFILREIDRIGEMLALIARRLGLLDGDTPDYSIEDVKQEFNKVDLPFSVDTVLGKENPVLYLVNKVNISNQGLETLMDILFHSDIDEARKTSLLSDALTYLDSRGYYSFRLHSLEAPLL